MDQEHIGSHLSLSKLRQQSVLSAGSVQNTDAAAQKLLAVRLFSRMTHLYAHKWASVYGATAVDAKGQLTMAAQQWLYDLRDFLPEQIARGLALLEKRSPEWPPSPLDFKRLCDGVPTLEEVLDRRNDYGPVCAKIRQRLDWFNLESMPSRQMEQAAERQYRAAVTSLSTNGTIARVSANAAIESRREANAEAIADENEGEDDSE